MESKRSIKSPPKRDHFCQLLQTIESKRETPSCYRPSAFRSNQSHSVRKLGAQDKQPNLGEFESNLSGRVKKNLSQGSLNAQNDQDCSRRMSDSESGQQIDIQQLFSKISVRSRSVESLLLSQSVDSEQPKKPSNRLAPSKFKFAGKQSSHQFKAGEKENAPLDIHDRSFALRTEILYKHFESNNLSDSGAESRGGLRLAQQNLNLSNQSPIEDSHIERQRILQKVEEFQRTPRKTQPKSLVWRRQGQASRSLSSDEDPLDYELIVHGYMKGLLQRVSLSTF